jgi:sulfur carrier protein ThiS
LSISVQLPPLLRTLSGGARVMTAEGCSVAEIMADLSKKYPLFARHLFDEAGAIRPNIVFLHDGVLVRAREAATHSVRDGDEIVLTNALAGG